MLSKMFTTGFLPSTSRAPENRPTPTTPHFSATTSKGAPIISPKTRETIRSPSLSKLPTNSPSLSIQKAVDVESRSSLNLHPESTKQTPSDSARHNPSLLPLSPRNPGFSPQHIQNVSRLRTNENGDASQLTSKKPGPKEILHTIEHLIPPTSAADEFLDIDQLMIVHERDMLDATKRPVGKQRISTNDASNYTIFGKTLREVSFFASTTAIFGGYELCLPLVVFNCVEELYRTGIYQSDLFCRLPDRQQLSKLIYIFDSTNPYQRYLVVNKTQRVSDYSTSTLLNKESTQDICALLSNYICSLPEPILPPYLFDPIWEWGRMDLDGEDTGVDRDETHVRRDRQGRRYSFPLSKSHSGPSEAAQIAIVQYLLHLLPYPHFSLLVYLLAFFSQVLMMGEENGMYSQELSRLFGTYLFGGETLSKSASCDFSGLERNGTRNEKGGERMMRWFLERWGSISDGLFDIFDEDSIDGRSASLITQLKRNKSPINLDATPSPSAWTPTHKTYDELFQFSERTLSLATSPTTVEQEGDKGKGKERDILDGPGFVKRSVHFEVPAPDAVDEMTSPSELSEEPKSPTDGRAEPELMTIVASVDSAPAVKDRLLDLSLSPAFNVSHLLQTLKLTEPPRTPKPAAQVSTSNSYIPPIEEQLHQARHQIRALKQALEESNAVTAEALEETYVARRHSMSLEKQLRVLEMGVGNRDSGRS